jgi:hypothetical protein
MNEYLFNFVLDEMRLQHQQNGADIAAWQKTLSHLVSFTLRYGTPMERLNPRPDFHEEKRQGRNSDEALLAVLNSCAQINESISNIECLTRDSFGNWILTLQKQRTGRDNVLALSCLSYLDLENCILDMKDFYGANLSRVNLKRAHLYYSNLTRAELFEANLEGANLKRANLEGANLKGTILEGKVQIVSDEAAEPARSKI